MLGIAVRKLVTLPNSTLGLVCDLLEKLSDTEWVEPVKKFLRKENPWRSDVPLWDVVTHPEFEVFKTIRLGTGAKSADDFISALKEEGVKTDDYVKRILRISEHSNETFETEVELVVLLESELGIAECASDEQIYRCAQKLGLDLCPPEVGPQLRLQYRDQSNGEWLRIAMHPIYVDDKCLIFKVGRADNEMYLITENYNPLIHRTVDLKWVFCRRK